MSNNRKKMGYKKRRRLMILSTALTVFFAVVALLFFALGGDSLSAFKQPSQVTEADEKNGRRIKMGGQVKMNSIQTLDDGLTIRFIITDCKAEYTALYKGMLPALFTEGQGVIAEGKFDAGTVLIADTILAKHDENYTPRGMEVDMREGVCTHPTNSETQ